MAVLCDLDSTLCLTEHRHHLAPTVDPSKTWTDFAMACGDDEVNWGVAVALNIARNAGYEIHFISGREPDAYEATKAWLVKHGIDYTRLTLLGAGVGSATNIDHKVGYIAKLRAEGVVPVLMYEDWPVVAAAIEAAEVPVVCINPRYHDMSWDQNTAPEHTGKRTTDMATRG